MLERIGIVVYILALPPCTRARNFFHVSLLKKYVHDPNHVIQVEHEGEFQTDPMCILDRKGTVLQNQTIGQVKVQWENYSPDEATWELEESMRLENPFLFNLTEH